MFEFLHGSDDAINLIKKDHENVKALFDKFEKADSVREKKKIAADTILELKLHAAIEEEIFYASVRKELGKKIMNEADEEHHVAKLLIAELEVMDGTEDHYDAKYKVLSENIRHHIKEEESEMLSKARNLNIDYNVLGEQILARKEELKTAGIPTFAEEEMVVRINNRGDSPAKNAKIIRSSAKKPIGKSGKTAKRSHAKKSAKIVKFPKKRAGKKTSQAEKKPRISAKPAKVKSVKKTPTKRNSAIAKKKARSK